jgi:superfamily II DNA helicase RecQ
LPNTKQSSLDKTTSAPFVELNPTASLSQSIIVTRHKSIEGCSVVNATPDSDNSRIGQIYYEEPPNISKTQWVVWCGLNSEQDAMARRLGDECVSIYGSLSMTEKMERWDEFASGRVPVLLTKASMFGFGINMQFSSHQIFLGLSDSFETYYQAVRRQWRFGQVNPVDVYIVTATNEGAVTENIKRKERDASRLAEGMIRACQKAA